MTQEARWTYYPWQTSAAVQLKFDDLVITQPSSLERGDWLPDFIVYADMSYLACRILMISSITVHPAALYMASQTIEKYMKALLLSVGQTEVPRTHNLTTLASRVCSAIANSGADQAIGDLFSEGEFLKLCEQLKKFDIAGRYPPQGLAGWRYSLNLLTFLDEFVARCRALIGIAHNTPNTIANLLTQETADNLVMAAAVAAVRDNNHHVDVLLSPPRPSGASLPLAMRDSTGGPR
jgi:HEPN domain-containing protein